MGALRLFNPSLVIIKLAITGLADNGQPIVIKRDY